MLFDLQGVIDRISTTTGYSVELGSAMATDQTDTMEDATRVYVTHINQTPLLNNAFDIVEDGYRELIVPMQVRIQVQLHCKLIDLVTTWNSVEASLQNYSPFPEDAYFSCLSFIEANAVAFAEDKVMWVAYYNLIVPRIS
jgi:hypothetical protein